VNAIVDEINAILAKHGIREAISVHDITVTERTVNDMVKSLPKLSRLVADHTWPSIRSATVYHYTSRDAAESILSTGIFRLTNIEKRHNEGEIITFCETHGLNGYQQPDANGVPLYRTLLMSQMYYGSFTETALSPSDEEYFWTSFAQINGVRLTLDISASNPDFRRMVYEHKPGVPIPLLAEMCASIRQKHGREFILNHISTLCSFYLCGKNYRREKEYRALFKSWPEFGPQPVGRGPSSYIEVPLNQETELGYEFRITEVHARDRPNMPGHYTFSQRTS
jgi:hypothetical protein